MKKIKTFSDYQKESDGSGVIGIIYATPDAGKSSLLLTLSKNYKTLYFDIEGLALPVFDGIPDKNKNRDNLFISNELESLEDLEKFLDTPEASTFDVIVIDSVSYLVGRMTANVNPAALKGNAVFGYYRDLGRHIVFIMDKAKKKGINLFMSFQATDDAKKHGGAWSPKIDGSEMSERVKELSNIMLFIQKSGFKKRILWQDTDDSFAYTKAKNLPTDHSEKIEFNGMEDFTMDFILGDRPLKKHTPPKKITEKQIKFIKTAIASLTKVYSDFKILPFLSAVNTSVHKIEDMTEKDYEKATLMVHSKLENLQKDAKK